MRFLAEFSAREMRTNHRGKDGRKQEKVSFVWSGGSSKRVWTRGLSLSQVKGFQIGFSPDQGEQTKHVNRGQGSRVRRTLTRHFERQVRWTQIGRLIDRDDPNAAKTLLMAMLRVTRTNEGVIERRGKSKQTVRALTGVYSIQELTTQVKNI